MSGPDFSSPLSKCCAFSPSWPAKSPSLGSPWPGIRRKIPRWGEKPFTKKKKKSNWAARARERTFKRNFYLVPGSKWRQALSSLWGQPWGKWNRPPSFHYREAFMASFKSLKFPGRVLPRTPSPTRCSSPHCASQWKWIENAVNLVGALAIDPGPGRKQRAGYIR